MSEMLLVLGNKNYSSWSFRPWIAMQNAGIAFDEKVVPLDFPSDNSHLLEFSPAKRVPVLIHGELRIWESMAILEYIAEIFPKANLWPQERTARAHARTISMEMHAGFTALRGAFPMNMHRKPVPLAIGDDVARDITRIDAIWSDCRQRFSGQGAFLFGNFSIADAMFAPVVSRFHSYQVQVSDVSAEYMKAVQALPSWSEWETAAREEDWIIEGSEI